MKNFNKYAESVLLTTTKPESDSVGAVDGLECPCQQDQESQEPVDMFTQSADDVLNNLGDVTQPDDGIGETGELQSDANGSDVEIECTDTGMWIKFGDFEMIIPKSVAQAIKKHVMEKMMEKMTEESEEGEEGDEHKETETEEEHEEHEAGETEEKEEKEEHAKDETQEDEDAEEHEAGETEEEEDDEEDKKDKNKMFESIKKPKCHKCKGKN